MKGQWWSIPGRHVLLAPMNPVIMRVEKGL